MAKIVAKLLSYTLLEIYRAVYQDGGGVEGVDQARRHEIEVRDLRAPARHKKGCRMFISYKILTPLFFTTFTLIGLPGKGLKAKQT